MSPVRTIQFDGWTLHLELGELVRDGQRIRLQDQPLQILDELLSRPGELVTREQLVARLWPKGVVDFDTGINSAVRKLRVALHDLADTPRYIETIPRKGYRFIGKVDPPPAQLGATAVAAMAVPTVSPPPAAAAPGRPWFRGPRAYGVAGILTVALVATMFLAWNRAATSRVPPGAAVPLASAPEAETIGVLPFRAVASNRDDNLLAQSITLLIRNRLATLDGLVVIAGASTAGLTGDDLDLQAAATNLHARYLVQGRVERSGDRMHLTVELIDATNGSRLWSDSTDRSTNDLAAVREEATAGIADALSTPLSAANRDATPVNLEAYQLYVRAEQLMLSTRSADAARATELFRRATILDPSFARAFLGLGQAQLLASRLTDTETEAVRAEAQQAFDHALELNPRLGEVWVERARLTEDPARAEALYRKGLTLAPNSGMAYLRYSQFLEDQYRKGEAFDLMTRARQIDPLSPAIALRQAFLLMVTRSDVAQHDRIVEEVLATNPDSMEAWWQLVHSRYEYHAEVAEAIRLNEWMLATEPDSVPGVGGMASMYLDVDDPAAASDVLQARPSSVIWIELAQYQHQWRKAAQLARSAPGWQQGWIAPEAEAIRDEAIATGDYASALKLLESRYAFATTGTGGLRMWNAGLGLVYAHTLVLSGETQRGRKLASAILVQIDSEQEGRIVDDWFGRSRGAAYAILGDDERALAHLTASLQQRSDFARWWYTGDFDPLYERLRHDSRFQALAGKARQHRAEQRALLDEMRRKGEVRRRP